MTRALRRLAVPAVVATAAALVLSAPSASASGGWLRTESSAAAGSELMVSANARISASGYTVTWPVTFTCPKGERYTMELATIEMNPPLVPELRGESSGIAAWGHATGTCTGRRQHLRASLAVVPTQWVDAGTGVLTEALLPISPATFTATEVLLGGDGFSAVWCYAPMCARDTGPRAVQLR